MSQGRSGTGGFPREKCNVPAGRETPGEEKTTVSVTISIKHALKKYGDNVIIPDLNAEIKQGEFFTLLGPSGCGKTTLLRMIAGFNSIEGGDFYFNDKRINDLDPAKRNIGMVFQNYAIFPHLTVRKNVEFGLKNKKLPKAQIAEQTDKFMKLMQIDQYADRLPERLSGGQQQRVALARALCIQPDVLLFDEPLSNLDAKLRVEMRTVIKNIQHIGTPKNIYQRPANLFVSTFIGRSNVMNGKLKMEDGKPVLHTTSGYTVALHNVEPEQQKDQDIILSVRPEEFLLNRDANAPGIAATVDDCVFLGLMTHYFVHLESGEEVEIIQESSIDSIIEPGTKIRLTLNTEKVNAFTADGNRNIMTGVRNDCVG